MHAIGSPADVLATAHVILDALDVDVRIDGSDGHHLARARRVRAGEAITAADGAGAWRAYEVTAVTGGEVTLHATGEPQGEPQLTPRLEVAFALTKGVKPEQVVRQLTELGVDRVQPVVADRSVARPDPSGRGGSGAERLRRVAREAAMQCRRAWLPAIGAPVPVAELAGRRGLVVADRTGADAAGLPDPGPQGWTLLVGPEGGLAPTELEALGAAPRLAVGPHVLRAETAAVAAAAVLSMRRRLP
jgi:16S rRNA (uracil1498-N3)-methyltransferase